MYFSYKQAKLVRAVEPKSKIWGVLGGYPLITGAYIKTAAAGAPRRLTHSLTAPFAHLFRLALSACM